LWFAILFIALSWLQPYAINVAIKVIPAISLAVLAFIAVSEARGKLLFVSLLFCAAGNIALELSIEMSFVLGLGMFLIAQIMFTVTFSRDFKMEKSRIPIIVLLVMY
jgi:uncharacterized membrane protein YhhN